MLVLRVHCEDVVRIGDAYVKILASNKSTVKLGVTAPKSVRIEREEREDSCGQCS